MKSLVLGEGSALVVVAHPDDETIWMGGTILKFQNVRWTIFSLCRSDDPDRAPRFKNACRQYGARGIISDLEDEGVMNINTSVPEIERRLLRRLARTRFTYVFTHGYNGEYGHPRHKGVHRAVRRLVRKKKLQADSLVAFSYRMSDARNAAVPDTRHARLSVVLSPKLFRKKKSIIQNLYGFRPSSFEARSSKHIETFIPLKNS